MGGGGGKVVAEEEFGNNINNPLTLEKVNAERKTRLYTIFIVHLCQHHLLYIINGEVCVGMCVCVHQNKRSDISETGEATPTKTGLHAFQVNLYLHESFEPILFFDPHGL